MKIFLSAKGYEAIGINSRVRRWEAFDITLDKIDRKRVATFIVDGKEHKLEEMSSDGIEQWGLVKEYPQTVGQWLQQNPMKVNGFRNPMAILAYVKDNKVGMAIGDVGDKFFFRYNVPIEMAMWSSIFPLYINLGNEDYISMTPIPEMYAPANTHKEELFDDMPLADWLNSKGAKYQGEDLTFSMREDIEQIFGEESVKATYDVKYWFHLTIQEAIYACLSGTHFIDDDSGGDQLITLPNTNTEDE